MHVTPGGSVKFGAAYKGRPVLSLFRDKKEEEGPRKIKLEASLTITSEPAFDDIIVALEDDEDHDGEPEDPRGRNVDIVT